MKWDLLLLDPPWQYDNKQQNDPARGGIVYDQMSMKDIYDLDIGSLGNDNSLLVCWVTFPKLCDLYYEKYDPLSCIRNWGYRPVTALFVWVKMNKNAVIPDESDIEPTDDYYSGLGRYTNSNAEIAIVARKGKMLERKNKDVKQLILAPIGKHSEKPQEQYRRLDRLFGDVSKLELFARQQNAPPNDWSATGLEFDGKDIKDFIRENKDT